MTAVIAINDVHLAVNAESIKEELTGFRKSARDFDELEKWMTENLQLFGGIPLQVGDIVSVTIKSNLQELLKDRHKHLRIELDVDVKRKAIVVDDIPHAFSIYNSDSMYSSKNNIVSYLSLSDWPLITAQAIARQRSSRQFMTRAEAFDNIQSFIEPYLTQHFPKLNIELLKTLDSLDLLPESYDNFVSFMFDSNSTKSDFSVAMDTDIL